MLSASCARIAVSAATGEWADFADQPDHARRVDAEFLRKLLLRLPIPGADHRRIAKLHPDYRLLQCREGAIPVSAPGLRIRHAIIAGPVDLANCAGHGGAALPPLILEHCRFERDGSDRPDLDLSNSTIGALSLDRCRFRHLRAVRGTVLSHLSLDEVGPVSGHGRKVDIAEQVAGEPPTVELGEAAGPDDCCWCNFAGAQIAGGVSLHGALLRVRPLVGGPSRYALHLNEAQVGGAFDARLAVFDGGITLNQTRVDGEVWLGGATILCGVGGAFEGQGLHCRGFFAAGRDRTLVLVGGLFLMNAHIGGDLLLRYPLLDARNSFDPAVQASLDMYCATVEGSMVVGATGDKRMASARHSRGAIGSMRLTAARILGSLELEDFVIYGLGRDALHAPLIEVGGNVRLIELWADRSVQFPLAKIGAGLIVHGGRIGGSVPDYAERIWARSRPRDGLRQGTERIAIGAEAITVAESIDIGEGLVVDGPVAIERAEIGSDVKIRQLAITDLQPVSIEAAARGRVPLAIGLAQTNIGGRLYLDDNQLAGAIFLELARAESLCYNASGVSGAERIELNQFEFRAVTDADEDPRGKLVDRRRALLAKMNPAKFDPQPYALLARVLHRQGHESEAREILILKKDAETADDLRHLLGVRSAWHDARVAGADRPGATLIVAKYLVLAIPRTLAWLTKKLFGALFGYGLKPLAALRTLAAAWLIGSLFFAFVENRGALVVDQQPVAFTVRGGLFGVEVTTGEIISEVPCKSQVSIPVYALDVLVPVIDLRQESKCEIGGWGPSHWLVPAAWRDYEIAIYRTLKTLYTFIGWIMISVAILTFSGLLRNSQLSE